MLNCQLFRLRASYELCSACSCSSYKISARFCCVGTDADRWPFCCAFCCAEYLRPKVGVTSRATPPTRSRDQLCA